MDLTSLDRGIDKNSLKPRQFRVLYSCYTSNQARNGV